MHLELFALADAANMSVEGKVNILGEFNVIHAGQLPAIWPSMTLVARIAATTAEGAEHELQIRIVDDDGRLAAPHFQAAVNFGEVHGPGHGHRSVLILPIRMAHFAAYGTYEIELLIDNARLGSIQLHVLPLPEPPA